MSEIGFGGTPLLGVLGESVCSCVAAGRLIQRISQVDKPLGGGEDMDCVAAKLYGHPVGEV